MAFVVPAVAAVGSFLGAGAGSAALVGATAITGLVGAGVQAVGAIEQGNANAAAAKYQAEVARNNAITANQNAAYAAEAGSSQATAASLRSRAAAAQATAALAAGGVDVNTGSAADVQTTQREFGKLDTEQVANNAALQVYGYRTQATNYQAQAQLDTAQAKQAQQGGILSAAGDIFSSAASLGSKWQPWVNTGVVETPAVSGNTIMSVYG